MRRRLPLEGPDALGARRRPSGGDDQPLWRRRLPFLHDGERVALGRSIHVGLPLHGDPQLHGRGPHRRGCTHQGTPDRAFMEHVHEIAVAPGIQTFEIQLEDRAGPCARMASVRLTELIGAQVERPKLARRGNHPLGCVRGAHLQQERPRRHLVDAEVPLGVPAARQPASPRAHASPDPYPPTAKIDRAFAALVRAVKTRPPAPLHRGGQPRRGTTAGDAGVSGLAANSRAVAVAAHEKHGDKESDHQAGADGRGANRGLSEHRRLRYLLHESQDTSEDGPTVGVTKARRGGIW